jgi:hypothetical protein
MKIINKFIIVSSTLLVCLGIKAQIANPQTDMEFMGRWLNWGGGAIRPNSNVSTAMLDPLNYSQGFFSEPFVVDIYVSSDLPSAWQNECINAAAEWNSRSNLAKINVKTAPGVFSEPRPTPVLNNFQNGLFMSSDPNLFDKGVTAKTFYVKFFDDIPADCVNNDPNAWVNGPVLFRLFIGINTSYSWFEEGNPIAVAQSKNTDIPLKSHIMHEFGHLLGLGHWGYNKQRIAMNEVHKSGVKYTLQPEDQNAINILYGNDGLSNSSSKFYNSIPCQYFESDLVGHSSLGPRGEPIGFGIGNPCDNCGIDPGEDGINCGSESGCGVLCEDLCSYNAENIVLTDYWTPMYDYTIDKNTVTLTASRGDINIPSGDFKYIKAGDYIDVKPSPFIFDTGILSNVEMVIGDCNCPDICTPRLPNVITANCDGVNDLLFFAVNGASSYEFTVRNRWGNIVYSESGPVNYSLGNKIVNWAGNGNSGGMLAEGVYWYSLKLFSSCLGTSKEFIGNKITILDPQDCNDDPLTKKSSRTEIADKASFEFYPNPVVDLLTIKTQSAAISTVSLSDMQGRKLERWEDIDAMAFQINLAKFGPNAFIVTVNTHTGITRSVVITKK